MKNGKHIEPLFSENNLYAREKNFSFSHSFSLFMKFLYFHYKNMIKENYMANVYLSIALLYQIYNR